MNTASESPIHQAEAILGSPYLSLDQVRWHHPRHPRHHHHESTRRDQNSPELVLESGVRQAIAVHNEAMLEHVPTPEVDVLMQVVRDRLVPHFQMLKRGDSSDLDGLLHAAQRMLEAYVQSDHAVPGDHETIIGIEHDVTGFIGNGLPPVLGRADLVTRTPCGVLVTNYRVIDSSDSEQIIAEYSDELHLIGALVAGSVDEHARLAGLRLVTLTNGMHPQTKTQKQIKIQLHRITLDESRLQSMIELVKSSWQRIID